MQPEVRARVPILALRAKPFTVGKCRLKEVEVTSNDIRVLIHDDTSQVLPHTLPHDAGLPVIHGETLFKQNRGNMS
jgi:hypothetical protein